MAAAQEPQAADYRALVQWAIKVATRHEAEKKGESRHA